MNRIRKGIAHQAELTKKMLGSSVMVEMRRDEVAVHTSYGTGIMYV